MRALAEFIMRGRVQATLVVAGAAVLPLLFWLSAAAVCLVLLRRGSDALSVLGVGVLSVLVSWHFLQDPTALLVLLGTCGLALVLRAGYSWNRVLLVSTAVPAPSSSASLSTASVRSRTADGSRCCAGVST